MKKIIKSLIVLTIIMTMIISLTANSYAVERCNAELRTAKTEVEKGEIFTVDVYLSNIQSAKGIIALSGIIEYDEKDVTLVEMVGKNEWDTPTAETSYNPANGKIAITRKAAVKVDEIVFTMKFQAKEQIKTTSIAVKELIVADGDTAYRIGDIKKDINIVEPKEDDVIFTSEVYTIGESDITKVEAGTTTNGFKSNVKTNRELTFVDKDGNTVAEGTKLATGMVVKVGNELSYTIVVAGDIDGNGEVDVVDLAKIKLHIIEYTTLTGINAKAADMDFNSGIDVNDMAKIKLVIINTPE